MSDLCGIMIMLVVVFAVLISRSLNVAIASRSQRPFLRLLKRQVSGSFRHGVQHIMFLLERLEAGRNQVPKLWIL